MVAPALGGHDKIAAGGFIGALVVVDGVLHTRHIVCDCFYHRTFHILPYLFSELGARCIVGVQDLIAIGKHNPFRQVQNVVFNAGDVFVGITSQITIVIIIVILRTGVAVFETSRFSGYIIYRLQAVGHFGIFIGVGQIVQNIDPLQVFCLPFKALQVAVVVIQDVAHAEARIIHVPSVHAGGKHVAGALDAVDMVISISIALLLSRVICLPGDGRNVAVVVGLGLVFQVRVGEHQRQGGSAGRVAVIRAAGGIYGFHTVEIGSLWLQPPIPESRHIRAQADHLLEAAATGL